MEMDCAALLENAEKQFLAGNLSQPDFASHIDACLPKACTDIYGSADIDLAGTGLYYSTLIQVALFVICGPLQLLISRCISPHARTSTNLSLARFQSVLDTTYSTGTLLGIGITIAGLMRASRYPVAALERSLIRDMSDLQSMLQNLAMATYIIMRTPAQITRGSRAWSPVGVYFSCQGINVATWWLKRTVDEIPSKKLIQRLCTQQGDAEKTFPDLNMSQAPGWNPFLTGAVLGIALVALGVTVSIYLPKVWKWLEKICESRVLQALFSFLWVAGSLLCTAYWTYHLTYTREGLEGTPAWDVGQVFVVVIWFPAVVQLFMTILMTLVPGNGENRSGKRNRVASISGLVVRGLYASWFGKEPYVEEAKPEDKPSDETDASPSKPPPQNEPSDEKVPLVSEGTQLDDESEMARNPSPGVQV